MVGTPIPPHGMPSGTARHQPMHTRRGTSIGCRLHSPAVSETGGGPTSPGGNDPGQTTPGWYNDPAGRFEYRYHNGAVWTSDVASNGQRYVDPLAPGIHRPQVATQIVES